MTLLAYPASTARPLPPAMPAAQTTQRLRAAVQQPSRYSGALAPAAAQGLRPETAARSLERREVVAHVGNRHPAADRINNAVTAVQVRHAHHLNAAGFNLRAEGVVGKTLAGGDGGLLDGFELVQCVHCLAPVDASNIAQDARNTSLGQTL
jgi:hypothetical protein